MLLGLLESGKLENPENHHMGKSKTLEKEGQLVLEATWRSPSGSHLLCVRLPENPRAGEGYPQIEPPGLRSSSLLGSSLRGLQFPAGPAGGE